jgi:hypothetical protein
MKILHIEKKGPKLNTLERFHMYKMTKKGLQINDTFTDIHNPVSDVLIKTHTEISPSRHHLQNTNSPPTHTNKSHTVYIYIYIYTQGPRQ